MHKYSLNLMAHGIDREEYGMLRYFCLLYPKKKRQLADLLYASPDPWRQGGAEQGPGNPVAAIAIKRERLLKDCEMIEQAAIEAVGGGRDDLLYQHLLRNVTRRKSPSIDAAPCGRRQFYECRKRFYICLWGRLNNC